MRYANQKSSTETELIEQKLSQTAKGMSLHWVPEQEANFDAGYMPTDTPARCTGTTRIEGKLYKVFQI